MRFPDKILIDRPVVKGFKSLKDRRPVEVATLATGNGYKLLWPGEDGFRFMREHGFRYHTMAEIERDGWETVMERALQEVSEGPEYLYISLDIDVLDPAYAPGTGTPEPGGLTTRELFPLVRRLCAENNVVGFELVEFNPLADPGYTTSLNANRALRECLTGIALRKRGIDENSLWPWRPGCAAFGGRASPPR